MDNLPVIYKFQKNAWMTRELFADWYDNHFKPSVRNFQLENGILGKTILLLDNCSGHKMPENYSEDENFVIMYLPPNTTSELLRSSHQNEKRLSLEMAVEEPSDVDNRETNEEADNNAEEEAKEKGNEDDQSPEDSGIKLNAEERNELNLLFGTLEN
nr:PREDICTED: tigger transposable element-derived protein 7-like [Megachile rotundata]